MRLTKLRLTIPAAACAVVLALGMGVASAATPKVTATPSTALANKQKVLVNWSGFSKKANTYLAVVECTTKVLTDQDQAHCDVNHAVLIGDGTSATPTKGKVKFTVHTGKIGTAGERCGTSKKNKDSCVIVVTGLDATLTPVPGQASDAPLDFAIA